MKSSSVAVAIAAVLLLAGCTAPTPTAESPSPTPTPSSPSPTPTPSEPAFEAMEPSLFFVNGILPESWGSWNTEDVNFAAPGYNIGCAILGPEHNELWGCSIRAKNWEFPAEESSDYCFDAQVRCGWGIEVMGAELPHPRMRSDPGFPGSFAADPIRVLEVGQSVTFNGVTCYSETDAIRCENASSGHGFVISADRNDIF